MSLTQEQLILMTSSAILGFVLGLLIAGIIALKKVGRLRTDIAVLENQQKNEELLDQERDMAIAVAERELSATFDQLADKSLRNHSHIFLRLAQENLGKFQTRAEADLGARQQAVEHMIEPMAKALADTREHIAKVERERHRAFGGIHEQLKSMNRAQQLLQAETANLVSALRRPEIRGRWGEVTLKRLVELAGMVEHCDFSEQTTVTTNTGTIRPDMVVRLPEDRTLVIDAKTPIDAYLTAIEAKDDKTQREALTAHAKQVRERIRELSSKVYWRQFKTSPDFIILFLPGDQFLSSALQIDTALLDDALAQKIVLATPSNLMALLKTVSYSWRQISLAKNAEHISGLAETLYQRLVIFSEHLVKVGSTLNNSVDAYNRAVGSLERNVLSSARKFTALGIRQSKKIPDLDSIEQSPRKVATAQQLLNEKYAGPNE